MQMGRAWLSELANNPVIGAPSRGPKLRPRRWHAEGIRPARHRWLSVQVSVLILPESCFTSMHFKWWAQWACLFNCAMLLAFRSESSTGAGGGCGAWGSCMSRSKWPQLLRAPGTWHTGVVCGLCTTHSAKSRFPYSWGPILSLCFPTGWAVLARDRCCYLNLSNEFCFHPHPPPQKKNVNVFVPGKIQFS